MQERLCQNEIVIVTENNEIVDAETAVYLIFPREF